MMPFIHQLNSNICAQVLTEVRDAPRTLRIAAPVAVFTVMLFYILANVAYVRQSPHQMCAAANLCGVI